MGVPKFFRYISERYPCLSELAREYSMPVFDNLYLDMNGIVHNCSHPDDSNIRFHIEEEQIFKDIFEYIDKLFFLIKPQKLFFMAIDGVAPRAKMNQQRSRRFRTAKEADMLERKAKQNGEKREHERFDSNCITPGTIFMARLHEALRYYIKNKISTDPLWQKCRIILSGHETPGEGEHKIMDYIRFLKSQSDFDPNTRHCLYGLDADLIILGLCTHEPHFVILREEIKFGRQQRSALEQTRFFLLHLGLLREYLELEFNDLRKLDCSFDTSKIIDDWILMSFLVGNDFIPHLPFLHISANALPILYKTYIDIFPKLGGFINDNGKLNLQRLEIFLEALSCDEIDLFRKNYADLQYFRDKVSDESLDYNIEETYDTDAAEINANSMDENLSDLISTIHERFGTEKLDTYNADEEKPQIKEFKNFKQSYYLSKFKQKMTSEFQNQLTKEYITALQWILDYYYRGVQSWDWYYPYHYAPFISDLRNFSRYEIKFNKGKPLLPFEQLLAVLPTASKDLLPNAYRNLMTDVSSDLIQFYPEEFELDLNGKKHEWESVILIPFIDEKLLLCAMKKCETKLTVGEKQRNTHGPMFQYDYNSSSQGKLPGVYTFKTVNHVFCTEKSVWSTEIEVSTEKSLCVKLPNTAKNIYFPGFPTMKNLQFDFILKKFHVKVFDFASRNDNMILMPKPRDGFDNIFTIAEKYLNQVVYVGWPHLIKAKIIAVANKNNMMDIHGIKESDSKQFFNDVKAADEHFRVRMGIEYNDLTCLVYIRTHIGKKLEFGSCGKIIYNDTWSSNVTAFPAQGIVSDITVNEEIKTQFKNIEQLFPVSTPIFFIGNPYYGSEGVIIDPMFVYECGRLKVSIIVRPEPELAESKYLQKQLESNYFNVHDAAKTIEISPKCLARLSGTILVAQGSRRKNLTDVPKFNIGLQLKFPKQNEERLGYTRFIKSQWFYSKKAIEVLDLYCNTFPDVCGYLDTTPSNQERELIFEDDIFPDTDSKTVLREITEWLKTQEYVKAERVTCGSKVIEKEAVQLMLESVSELKNLPVKTVKLQVKPHLLIKPNVTLPTVYKSKHPINLFDRVIVVRTTYLIPIGSKGTVVGIYPVIDRNPVRMECVNAVENFYEVLFDKRITSCNDMYDIAQERVYRIPENALLVTLMQDKPIHQRLNQKSTSTLQNNSNLHEIKKNYILQTTSTKKTNDHCLANKCINHKNTIVDFWTPKVVPKLSSYLSIPTYCKNSTDVMLQDSTSIKQNTTCEQRTENVNSQKHTTVPTTIGSIFRKDSVNNLKQEYQQKPPGQSKMLLQHQQQTIALKSLLGLNNQTTHDCVPIFCNKFKNEMPKLPQPPLLWQNDAKIEKSKSSSIVDLASISLPIDRNNCRTLEILNPLVAGENEIQDVSKVLSTSIHSSSKDSLDYKEMTQCNRKKRVPRIGAKFDFAD